MNKIKIQIDYENSKTSMEIEPHQKIKEIKENLGKIFYPLNKEVKLYHMNRDISNYDNMLIGKVFKNKNKISIKASNKNKNLSYSVTSNRQEKSLHDSTIITDKKYKISCKCGSPLVSLFCRRCEEFECVTCQNKIVIQYLIFRIPIWHIRVSKWQQTIQKKA